MSSTTICMCGSTKNYSSCCGIAHNNIMNVKTAEQLMRSRYSAFCMANKDFLLNSHHSSTRPNKGSEIDEIVEWAKSVIWIKLKIMNTTQGKEDETFGTVEFKAYYLENGIRGIIHENSSFEKENGHWVYVDGTQY